ncbi:glycine-rich protein [Wolffia australiana]
MIRGGGRGGNGYGGENGVFWKLPVVRSKELGKLGPGVGLGAGCGVGLGVGLFGGAGVGLGFPGLSLGFGVGAGCGVGLGFGYGLGRGVATDEYRRYSNVGNSNGTLLSQDHLISLVDELVENTKKLVRATSKSIEKWR